MFRESANVLGTVAFGLMAVTSATGDSSESMQKFNKTLMSGFAAFQGINFAMSAMGIASGGLITAISVLVGLGVALYAFFDNSKEKAKKAAEQMERFKDSAKLTAQGLSSDEAKKELDRTAHLIDRQALLNAAMEDWKKQNAGAAISGHGLAKAYDAITAQVDSQIAVQLVYRAALQDVIDTESQRKLEDQRKAGDSLIGQQELRIKKLEEEKNATTDLNRIQAINLQLYAERVKLDRLQKSETPFNAKPLALAGAGGRMSTDMQPMQLKTVAGIVDKSFGEAAASKIDNFGDAVLSLKDGLDGVTDSFLQMAAEGGASFGELLSAFRSMAVQMIAGMIALGVAGAVKAALISVPFPFNIIAAGIAGAAAATLFSAIVPKFAKGGLAFGSTLAMVGDNPNARTDPEVIAPLSRLQGIMGGGFNLNGQLVARGTDLVYIVDRVRSQRGRVS